MTKPQMPPFDASGDFLWEEKGWICVNPCVDLELEMLIESKDVFLI